MGKLKSKILEVEEEYDLVYEEDAEKILELIEEADD